jgi:hypothetical protein
MSEQEGSYSPSKSCPNCGGDELYRRRVPSGGAPHAYLLRGLGSFLHYAEFDVVICADCGLMQLFAEPEARQNVKSSADWLRL